MRGGVRGGKGRMASLVCPLLSFCLNFFALFCLSRETKNAIIADLCWVRTTNDMPNN